MTSPTDLASADQSVDDDIARANAAAGLRELAITIESHPELAPLAVAITEASRAGGVHITHEDADVPTLLAAFEKAAIEAGAEIEHPDSAKYRVVRARFADGFGFEVFTDAYGATGGDS